MSNRPNAYLAFCHEIQDDSWGEFEDNMLSNDDDMDTRIDAMLGLDDALDWSARRRARAAYGVSIENDGCGAEEDRRFVCAKVHHTDWDDVLSLPSGSFDTSSEWQAKIQATAAYLGLKLIGECEWKLFAYYG